MTFLERGVLDTSALVSVLNGEPSADAFLDGFYRCERLVVSASTAAEASLVVFHRAGTAGLDRFDRLLALLAVETAPVEASQVPFFREGFQRYGKGRHSANLNFGDLFAYALARQIEAPLFFQGLDFDQTDVAHAMRLLGYPISSDGMPFPGP